MRNDSGITVVALIVTVIVLMILVGVSVNFLTEEEESAIHKAEEIGEEANELLSKYETEIDNITGEIAGSRDSFKLVETNYTDPSGANEPTYISGLLPISFTHVGTPVVTAKKSEWFNYQEKKWANAKSQDDSLWVWIPRFAYKMAYTNDSNKSLGGNIEVVFLNGTTNNYLKDGRWTDAISDGYTVHPSFRAAVEGSYSNGEWDKELTGYWVAKFEAGFQQGNAVDTSNNDVTQVVRSNVNYTSGAVYLSMHENGGTDGYNTARNYIDGIYGENVSGDLEDLTAYNIKSTKISYPVFKGATYAMNYISVSDAYSLCKDLAAEGNIYGFDSATTLPHLMKNSEWGAVAYLSYSQYGTNGAKVYSNNVNLDNTVKHIHSVTGYSGDAAGSNPVGTLVGAHIWYTEAGQKASSNHNITGVYDLVGGVWERVSAYVDNANTDTFGYSMTRDAINVDTEKIDTKFVTRYQAGEIDSNVSNYITNGTKIGDATVETSSAGEGASAWGTGTSMFASEGTPFFNRGGSYNFTINTGVFSYGRTAGYGTYDAGFRAVLASTGSSITTGKSDNQ